MIKEQEYKALISATLGLIVVLISSLSFILDNLWVLIGVSVFVSFFSVFLSYGIMFFFGRRTQDWDFGSTRDAHQKLASIISRDEAIKEMIIVAYTSNSAYRMLELFDKKNCKVDRLKILLRNPVTLLSGEGKEGAIPN
ncbi:MAG: hypothetical protein GY757_50510, partial [bacterium]|nr:hypothetical protein [bacterium]